MVFLWELIEDYKAVESDEEKDQIFNTFCDMVWNCPEPQKLQNRNVEYTVNSDLMKTDLGKEFYKYERIKYQTTKRETDSLRWECLIKQKINNLYATYVDRNLCVSTEYSAQIHVPKRLYFEYRANPEAFPYTAEEVGTKIREALERAARLRYYGAQRKPTVEYNEFKTLCTGWMRKCFENCILLDSYDESSDYYEADSEDNFYVSYICKSLEGYVKNWKVEWFGIKRQRNKYKIVYCERCGKPFTQLRKTNKRMYCDSCRKIVEKDVKRKYYYRHKEKFKNGKYQRGKWDSIIIE